MQKQFGREFLNLGMSCTYSQYEEWRRKVAEYRLGKGIRAPLDKYIKKKVNEYNIQKALELRLKDRDTMTPLIDEIRIKTMREAIIEFSSISLSLSA